MDKKIWEEFKQEKAVINCETYDEAKEFMKLLYEKGHRQGVTNAVEHSQYGVGSWLKHKNKTAYRKSDFGIQWCFKEYYKKEGYKIYTYKELMNKNNTYNQVRDIKHIKNGRATIVQIGDKKGIAKCHEEDIDKQDDIVGLHLALLRAEGITPEELILRFKKCGVVKCSCDKKKDENKDYKIINGNKVVKQDVYEIGDRVLIRSDLRCGERYGENVFNSYDNMNPMLGKIVTIKSKHGYGYLIKEMSYIWTHEMIEGKIIEEKVFKDIATDELLSELKKRTEMFFY